MLPAPEETARFTASIASMNTFKRGVRLAFVEFLHSGDKEEFLRCVRELNSVIFHPELVKVVVSASLDRSADDRDKVRGNDPYHSPRPVEP